MSKATLVRWLPVALSGGLALLGVATLGVAANGLTLTLSPPPTPSSGIDPLVLLREDQAAVQDEVRQLGSHLEGLATALEAASAADEQARARALGALASRLERRLDGLEARLATAHATAAVTTAVTAAVTTADAAPPTSVTVSLPASSEAAAAPPDEPTAQEPAAPTARGVFSFKMERGLDLDERQRFEVIASLSRVGFDAKSTLHDFSGVTSDVSGWIEARLADPGTDARGQIQARAATLRTGIDGRDEEMRARLDTEHHPELRFDWTGFELEQLDRATSKLRGHATGTLTIHGVARAVRVPVNVEVDPQRRLLVSGEVLVFVSHHGIEPPDMGVIRMEDQVKVWLSLRLRALGRARAP